MGVGRAKLAMGQGVSVWVLDAPAGFGGAEFHSHHAIQLTICLSGSLTLSGDAGTISAPVIAVAADAPHRLDARGLLVIVFVEPESRAGRKLRQMLFIASLAGARMVAGGLVLAPWTGAILSQISIAPDKLLGALLMGCLRRNHRGDCQSLGLTEPCNLAANLPSRATKSSVVGSHFFSALLFALAHLPEPATLTELTKALVIRTIVLNGHRHSPWNCLRQAASRLP